MSADGDVPPTRLGETGAVGEDPVAEPRSRTLLAWSRSNAALVTAGLLLARFGYELGSVTASVLASAALVVIAVAVAALTHARRRPDPPVARLLVTSAFSASLLCLAATLVAARR